MTVFFDFSGFSFGVDVFTATAFLLWTLFLVSVIRARERLIYQPEPSPGWRELLHRAGLDIATTFPEHIADECQEILEIAGDECEEAMTGRRPAPVSKKPETFGELQVGDATPYDEVEMDLKERRYRRTRPSAQEAAERLRAMGYK